MKYTTKHKTATLVVRILLGLLIAATGVLGFVVETPEEKQTPFMLVLIGTGWMIPWISIFKMVTGILLFIPRTAPLATLMLLPFMVNVMLFALFSMQDAIIMATLALVMNVWLIYAYSDRYQGIIAK